MFCSCFQISFQISKFMAWLRTLLLSHEYSFARALVAKYQKLSGLNNSNSLSHSLEVQVKMPAGLALSEDCESESVPCFSPCFWWLVVNVWHSLASRSITLILVCIFPWPSLSISVCLQLFPFNKNISQ